MKLEMQGSIFLEQNIYVARDTKERYVTCGNTLENCQRALFNLYKETFPNNPVIMNFETKLACVNYYAVRNRKFTQRKRGK